MSKNPLVSRVRPVKSHRNLGSESRQSHALEALSRRHSEPLENFDSFLQDLIAAFSPTADGRLDLYVEIEVSYADRSKYLNQARPCEAKRQLVHSRGEFMRSRSRG